MPLEFTPVAELNSSKQEWKVRVMISRIWEFHQHDKPDFILGMEVILVDAKGTRIGASIKTKLVKKFRKELKEGECRDIMHFEVSENNGDYRGTNHDFKISFLFNTYLKPCVHIPNVSRFSFCPFQDIASQSNLDDVFIDIIGEVVGMSNVKHITTANNPSKLLELKLRDLNDTIIDCTLWGKDAEDVHSYVKNNQPGPVVFLGSLMRTKKFNGKMSVQNSRFSTKLFINGDIEEISVFKSKIAKSDNPISLTVSPLLLSSSAKSTKDEFPLHNWKTIETFTAATEETSCVTFASIITFRKELPWYYVGCNVCFNKATPYFNPETEEVEKGKYSCDTCNKQETSTSLRYSVHVTVADHTATTSFLLFDREVIQLTKKSAYELLEQQVEFNREGEIPTELIGLEGMSIVWIIRLHGAKKHFRNSSFKVVKLSNEDEVVQKFEDNVVLMESSQSEIPLISSTSSALQIENSSSEANNSELPQSSPVTPAAKRQRQHMIEKEVGAESSTKIDTTGKASRNSQKMQIVKREAQYERKAKDTNRK